MSVLPKAWNTVKTLVTAIPGEVNIPLLLTIVAETEIIGGGFDKIFTAILDQATLVFPDPVFRNVAVAVLTELHRIAAAPPTTLKTS